MITDGLLDMDFDSDLLIDDNSTSGRRAYRGTHADAIRQERIGHLPETSDTDEEEE